MYIYSNNFILFSLQSFSAFDRFLRFFIFVHFTYPSNLSLFIRGFVHFDRLFFFQVFLSLFQPLFFFILFLSFLFPFFLRFLHTWSICFIFRYILRYYTALHSFPPFLHCYILSKYLICFQDNSFTILYITYYFQFIFLFLISLLIDSLFPSFHSLFTLVYTSLL